MTDLIKVQARGSEALGSVVFVHGLDDSAEKCWQHPSAKDAFWPHWIAEDVPQLGVILADYEASKTKWGGAAMHPQDRAGNMLERLLVEPELEAGPLAFVSHSLGGLLVKQLLRLASDRAAAQDEEAAAFVNRVTKVVFFATPHTGSGVASLADALRIVIRPSDATASLKDNDPNLHALNVWYRDWSQQQGIDHLNFSESEPLHGMIVVPADSADPGLPFVRTTRLDGNHSEICKFKDREKLAFLSVRKFLKTETPGRASQDKSRLEAAHTLAKDIKDDTQAIRENVARLTAELSMGVAQREALVAELAKVKSEYGGTVDLVSGFLQTMVGRKIAPEQFAATLFKIAADWKTAGEKINALTFSGNLSPRLSSLRDQARTAHEVGQLDEAERLLAEIARDEADALRRLEEHEREVLEELRLRRRGLAETKVAQAAVAHARLRYREAAALYAEAAGLVMAFDPEKHTEWLSAQAKELYDHGNEFGDNSALTEAVDLLRQLLILLPRKWVPLDWAMTQNNLGNALAALGERENGTAMLKKAVTAFEAALEERTRERVPLDWAMTQNNLGWALALLGDRRRDVAMVLEGKAAVQAAWDVCRSAGYNQYNGYFAERIAAFDAAIAELGEKRPRREPNKRQRTASKRVRRSGGTRRKET